jgi:hypothetical protein
MDLLVKFEANGAVYVATSPRPRARTTSHSTKFTNTTALLDGDDK